MVHEQLPCAWRRDPVLGPTHARSWYPQHPDPSSREALQAAGLQPQTDLKLLCFGSFQQTEVLFILIPPPATLKDPDSFGCCVS